MGLGSFYTDWATSDIGKQTRMLEQLYGRVEAFRPDVALGTYGEESRLKQSLGSNIAAAGGGVRGTYNMFPLYGIGERFSGQRMQLRNAAEQARIMNLLKIAGMRQSQIGDILNTGRFELMGRDLEEKYAFNLANLLPNIQATAQIPFTI